MIQDMDNVSIDFFSHKCPAQASKTPGDMSIFSPISIVANLGRSISMQYNTLAVVSLVNTDAILPLFVFQVDSEMDDKQQSL